MDYVNTGRDAHQELVRKVDEELRAGAIRDDSGRLAILEDLYRSLENELEGDLDKEGSARR